ncbi:hypothetical protein DRQ07_03305 [candidate division KSB1 bacterium]|nr:MAG: hypothetical protein DRQ07_03305 [candidate division KSB1 bacterium]
MRYKLLIIILIIFAQFHNGIPGTQYDENTIKSVYIGRFAQFVDIPLADSSFFVIGVFEKNGLTPSLEALYKNVMINGVKVKIKYFSKIDSSLLQCQIIFIPKVNNNKLKRILNIISGYPLLSVSNEDNYAEKGVHINLYRDGNNIKFEINQQAVKKSGLHISYKLYQLARIVHPIRVGK